MEEKSYEFNTDLSYFNLGLDNVYNVVDIERVKRWLKDHITYNKELRDTSKRLYNANGVYTNVIDYMVALPTLDRVVYSLNRNHSRYKRNKEKFIQALKMIKDKSFVRDAIFKLALEGTAFYYFETTESNFNRKYLSDLDVTNMTEINNEFNCSTIPLPTDYCKIVGFKNSSYLVAFDCSYFDRFTGNGRSLRLRRYPKEIRDAYRVYKSDMNRRWVVLNNDKTLTFKVRAKLEDAWGRPIGLAAFVDMLYDEYYVDTKRNLLDELNSTIIYQTFPEGEKKGTSSLTQKQQKDQHENIKNALFSKGLKKGINFFSVAAGTKLDKIVTNVDFLKVKESDELIKRISTHLGFAGSALNGQDGNYSSQQTNINMVSAELFSWIEQIQDELNKVINRNIIKDNQVYVEVDYLRITHANRKEMFSYAKDLYTQGRGSLQFLISSAGINPESYLALMDEELEEGFDDKYPVHQTSYTQSGKDNKKLETDNPSDATLKNKTTGAGQHPHNY
jgi:hypothetical protein